MTPSVGNFVLIHFPDDGKHSAEAADAFLTAARLHLAAGSGYGFPNALRMTVGTEEANRGVVAALAEFLGELEHHARTAVSKRSRWSASA